MKKSIAFIDCFIETPVNHCVNDFIIRSKFACTYHMPSKYGMDSLNSLGASDAYIVLGSASHVSDKLPWHQKLLEFLIPKLENGTPVLGICFGHQLLANHYGCEVDYINNDRSIMTETRTITITSNQMGLEKDLSLELPFAHAQVVTKLSSQMQSFASSKLSPHEALKHIKYPLWSFQAHPEASEKFIREDANVKDLKKVSDVKEAGYKILDSFTQLI